MSAKRLLVVAKQAGTGNALAPVITELRRRGWTVTAVALEQASTVWGEREGVVHVSTTADAANVVSSSEADIVLTGTSLEAREDAKVWHAARARDILCIGYVDGWINYEQRFSVERLFDELPDVVAVVDEQAASQIVAAGLPMAPVIVGNPVFDDLSNVRLDDDSDVILLATEPVAADRGFHQRDVVQVVLAAVDRLPGQWRVVLKPHPRELRETYQMLERTCDFLTVAAENADRVALLSSARVVVGITSMLQVEAAMVGLPVLSVQPTGRQFESLICEERGILTATTPSTSSLSSRVQTMLGSLLKQPIRLQPITRAAPYFADVLEELTS